MLITKFREGYSRVFLRRQGRGQTVVEFAIFGSIAMTVVGYLLLYGLSANYEQNLQLQTVRYGLNKAKDPKVSQSYRDVDITVVRDLTLQNELGETFDVAASSPNYAQAQASWSFDLMATMEGEEDLPRVSFLINGKYKNKPYYTIAGYGTHSVSAGEVFRKKVNDIYSAGQRWKWESVNAEEVGEGDFIDIDHNDATEEQVLVLETTTDDYDNVASFRYLDFQKGEIDTTKRGAERQGLQENYLTEAWANGTLDSPKQQKSSIIEKITRYLKTNANPQGEAVETTVERNTEVNW